MKYNDEKSKYLYHDNTKEISSQNVEGYNFDNGLNYENLIKSFATTGFQATHLSQAISIANEMIEKKSKIYLGYTSNMVTSGVRDIIRYLVKNKKVNVLSTTGGGIEEDIMKCLGDFKLGNFNDSPSKLIESGANRAGNILIPDARYVAFEKFLIPILEELHQQQKKTKKATKPSDIVRKLGEKIDDKRSIYYWAYKNDIPVYSHAILDGSLGDIVYVFIGKNPDFVVDVAGDVKELNDSTAGLESAGAILLGGGVSKHSILNAHMFRNGLDFAVYINTAPEFDGSDSGAEPNEAMTWGKIKVEGRSVKVHGDATILFPLLVSQSFAK